MMQIKKRSSKYFARKRKQSRIIRYLRNILIGFVVLLVLVIVAGVLYTWYMGQHATIKQDVVPIKTSKPKSTEPAQLAPNAKEGVAIQALTTPVKPGENTSISVKTNRESKCTITAVYNKIPSKDTGLSPKTADEYGMVSWSWTVESTVPVGKWPVTVTCVWNKKAAVVIGDLLVTK